MDDDTSIEGYSERNYKEWLEIPEEVQGYHHKNYYECGGGIRGTGSPTQDF